jgi:hypothetical protein
MNGAVYALVVHKGDLIAAGSFTMAGGVNASRIARWNGDSWQPLGAGIDGFEAHVRALAVHNGDLIAGGAFDWAGGERVQDVARWDGVGWHAMNDGLCCGGVKTLAVFEGALIAGGSFTSAGQGEVAGVARWDGASWHAIAPFTRGFFAPYVEALVVHGTRLIVGGSFFTAAGISASNVAAWDGEAWQPLGSGMNSTVLALASHDQTLFAAGAFGLAGDEVAARFAQWAPVCPEGDVNRDGVVDVDDLIAVILAWGPCANCATCPADMNHNCQVDADDLIAVILNWG